MRDLPESEFMMFQENLDSFNWSLCSPIIRTSNGAKQRQIFFRPTLDGAATVPTPPDRLPNTEVAVNCLI